MSQLYAYLGINESGQTELCVCPWKLNKLSPMHRRGDPFPRSVLEYLENKSIETETVLADLNRYYEPKRKK